MKKIIDRLAVAIILISGAVASGQAREYIPMLTDGKEWAVEEKWWGCLYKPFHQGNTYMRIVVIGDSVVGGKPCKVMGWNYCNDERFYDGENVYRGKKIGYEEDGCVYAQAGKSFVKIMDFNLEEGDKVGVGYDPNNNELYDIVVDKVDYITVGGIERKRLSFMGRSSDDSQIWVEGLGMFSPHKILGVGPITIGIGPATRSASYEYLAEVRDNGCLIADRDDFTAGIDLFPVFDRMVTAGKIWVYGGRNPDGSVYKSWCRFDDRQIRLGDRFYMPFSEYLRHTWKDASMSGEPEVTSGGTIPTAYLRELGGIVYMMNPKKGLAGKEWNEYPIYDMSMKEHDYTSQSGMPWLMLTHDFSEWELFYINPDIIDDSPLMVGRSMHRAVRFMDEDDDPNLRIVEGVGPLDWGYLPYIENPSAPEARYMPHLLELLDSDGNPIEQFTSMREVCGVTAAGQDAGNDRRRIRPDGLPFGESERGIYIEDGKLHFAK